MSTRVLIGLGGNMGDRRARLDGAIAALAATPGIAVRAVSGFRETAPVGGPSGQQAFLNAAAALDTTREPNDLLHILLSIETQAGRVHTVRWGERPLDLDLLLYGDEVLTTPTLIVPHPRMAVRRFVLGPLREIAPDVVDPVTGRTVADLLANLDRRPSVVALAGDPALVADLARRLEDMLFEDWVVTSEPGNPSVRPTFVAEIGLGNVPAGPTPRLSVLGGDGDALATEILAACVATRTG